MAEVSTNELPTISVCLLPQESSPEDRLTLLPAAELFGPLLPDLLQEVLVQFL